MLFCILKYIGFTRSLKQQYSITDVRYDILRLFGMAKTGCWEEIRQLYAQRKNIIPIEVDEEIVMNCSASYKWFSHERHTTKAITI